MTAEILQLVGMALFLLGIAVGALLVFTDRHRYPRPVALPVVLGALASGFLLFLVGWLLQ